MGESLSKGAIATIIQKLVRRAKLGDPLAYGGHSLRAAFVTEARGNGATDRQIMKQTGHKSVAMVHRYTCEDQQDSAMTSKVSSAWLVRGLGRRSGIGLASIDELYRAGRPKRSSALSTACGKDRVTKTKVQFGTRSLGSAMRLRMSRRMRIDMNLQRRAQSRAGAG